ncbi:PAZ domain - like 10, partial [Theobroma cacao]
VSITPEVASKKLNRIIVKQFTESYKQSHLGGRCPAYDGGKSLYTAGALPFESKEFLVRFTLDDKKTNVSVVQYFREKYNIVLKYASLPALQSGSEAKPVYMPMELCQIVEGQRYTKKLNDQQVKALLKATCRRPRDRERDIKRMVNNNNFNGEECVNDFGIQVGQELAFVDARVGGRNTVLNDAIERKIPLVTDLPTIIFGADVTHPKPGEDSSPSIAAVVGSMDWPEVTKYRGIVSAQAHREEIIQDLYKIVQDPQKGVVHSGMIRYGGNCLWLSINQLGKNLPGLFSTEMELVKANLVKFCSMKWMQFERYARCTRSVSIVPPAYYAHLAAFRARYYIEDETSDSGSTDVRRSARDRNVEVRPLPSIRENVKEVMFYC